MKSSFSFLMFAGTALAFAPDSRKAEEVSLKVKAFQQAPTDGASVNINTFPEKDLSDIQSRSNTAVIFSGGGSRAYIAALGYLSGLTKLDLMKNIRYIGGTSGGSWATTTYTYNQNRSLSDIDFLGDILNPEEMTSRNLKHMDEFCARSFTNTNMMKIALDDMKHNDASQAESWRTACQQVYLDKIGVVPNSYFSYNQQTVDDIKARNPSLQNEIFLLPRDSERPYMIIGTSLIGPSSGAPYNCKNSNQNVTLLDITPLYIGQGKTMIYNYKYADDNTIHDMLVGGGIESYAFYPSGDTNVSYIQGLSYTQTTGEIQIPKFDSVFDLGYSIAASSYAPALFEDSLPRGSDWGGMSFDYFSPASPDAYVQKTLFGDGGITQNVNLISMLQRNVERIVLFSNGGIPLQPSSEWDVDIDEPQNDQISGWLSSYWGILPTDSKKYEEMGEDYSRNQVFSKDDWSTFVHMLQDAQETGNGIIATLNNI